jgi:hypothetical protein
MIRYSTAGNQTNVNGRGLPRQGLDALAYEVIKKKTAKFDLIFNLAALSG